MQVYPNGHGKYAALNNETRDVRSPYPVLWVKQLI